MSEYLTLSMVVSWNLPAVLENDTTTDFRFRNIVASQTKSFSENELKTTGV